MIKSLRFREDSKGRKILQMLICKSYDDGGRTDEIDAWVDVPFIENIEDIHMTCTNEWHNYDVSGYTKKHGAWPRSCPECHFFWKPGEVNNDLTVPSTAADGLPHTHQLKVADLPMHNSAILLMCDKCGNHYASSQGHLCHLEIDKEVRINNAIAKLDEIYNMPSFSHTQQFKPYVTPSQLREILIALKGSK